MVEHHLAPDGTEGYSIEVFNAPGDTIAVTSVPPPPSKPSAKTKYSSRAHSKWGGISQDAAGGPAPAEGEGSSATSIVPVLRLYRTCFMFCSVDLCNDFELWKSGGTGNAGTRDSSHGEQSL